MSRWIANLKRILMAAIAITVLSGCGGETPPTEGTKSTPQRQRYVVVCTTTINREIAEILAGELVNPVVEIHGLMEPGDDPHHYAIRARDLQLLRKADLILMNGLELEPTLEPLLAEHAKGAVIVRLGEASGVKHLEGKDGKPDPHVWMSPNHYGFMLERAAGAMAKIITRHAALIRQRAQDHLATVKSLQEWVLHKAAQLPPDRAAVLTSDDGLAYLGHLLNLEIVHHEIDLSTLPTVADREALFAAADEHQAKAVFIDRGSSSSWYSVVADLGGIRHIAVGPGLVTHWIGEKNDVIGSYEGLIRKDVETIVQVLSMERAIEAASDRVEP